MYKYNLYVTSETPAEEAGNIKNLLEGVKEKHGLDYEIIDIDTWDEEKKEELLESIRVISRKNGKGVVSKGRGALPISRSGKVGNIGILVQMHNGKLNDVFPHVKNNKRIDGIMHLRGLIQADNLNDIREQESISEADISRMITTLPELIEKGLKFLETEVEIKGGRIDAVFEDKNGAHFLIEIELKAKDNATGQVQRFKLPYSEKFNLPPEKIRLGIVCTDIGESRLIACKSAGIDVFKLNLLKLT